MTDYAVLGGVLRSELEFPELPIQRCDRPDWKLRIGSVGPPPPHLAPLGERRVGREVYRLSKIGSGLCLEYSETGWYEVATNDALVVWHPRPGASPEIARWIVLGPILAILLEAAGCFCLHGSAVVLGQRAIAFVGPKHFGKSTLATALTAAGGRLIADDIVALDRGHPVTVRPGIASVRLWQDAARELGLENLCDTVIQGVKFTAMGFAGSAQARENAALTAVYLLDPVVPREATDRPVWRTRLAGTAAAIALAQQSKLPDSLVGYPAAGVRLEAAAATAASVPVWTLHVVRDFGILPKVVERMLEWHPLEPALPQLTNG